MDFFSYELKYYTVVFVNFNCPKVFEFAAKLM